MKECVLIFSMESEINMIHHMFCYERTVKAWNYKNSNIIIFLFLALTTNISISISFCLSVCLSLSGLLRTFPPFSRPLLLDIAMEILVKKGKKDDESIHSFFSRRLGKEVNSDFSQTIVFFNCETNMTYDKALAKLHYLYSMYTRQWS